MVEVHVGRNLIERVDSWIEESGQAISRDDAIHQLLESSLDALTGRSIRLTDGDKLNFMMLRDIMNHLKVKDAETNVELLADVIYEGHYWAPTWEMQGLFHRHSDKPEDVKLVTSTLDMWSFIEEAVEKLEGANLELVKEANYGFLPKFAGFDGNEEGELMSIAKFLVEKMNRFSRFRGREFNSHSNQAEASRRMVKKFDLIRPNLGFKNGLSADQIIELIND